MLVTSFTRSIRGLRSGRPAGCGAGRAYAAAVAFWLLPGVGAVAIPPTLTEVVPHDAVVAYFSAQPKDAQSAGSLASTVGLVSFLADRAQEVGLLSGVDDCSRMWVDSLASLSTVLGLPHTVMLFDVQARPRSDGGHELASLKGALVCHTRGANEGLERRIQHLLNTYTNREDTRLSERKVGAHDVFALRDARLPPWVSFNWGPFGDYYVLGIGEGAFERATANITQRLKSLPYDAWFQRAFAEADGVRASVAWYIRFDELSRKADALFDQKVARVQDALRMRDVERGLWTVGFADRALEIKGVRRRNGVDEVSPIASRRFLSKLNERIIPDQATGYAVIDCNPRTVLESISEAYLASRSPDTQAKSGELWGRLAADAGVQIHEDIMSQLGTPVVIHDYPPHAFRLPLAWTILVRISGDADVLRERIDHWLENARKEYAETGLLQLRHDEDGVWYIQYGLMGPAMLVTDNWLVVGFSPQAVRQNLQFVLPEQQTTSSETSKPALSP